MKIGDAVLYINTVGTQHNALAQAVHPNMGGEDHDGLNVVYVNPEGGVMNDTSVYHQGSQPAGEGQAYWRGVDEVDTIKTATGEGVDAEPAKAGEESTIAKPAPGA